MHSVAIGQPVRIAGTFKDPASGVLIDPSLVAVSYRAQKIGTQVILTFGIDAAVVRDSIGKYHVDVDTTPADGIWDVRFYSTGTAQAAAITDFSVQPDPTQPSIVFPEIGPAGVNINRAVLASGDGTTVAFGLPAAFAPPASLMVFVNGILQDDYIASGTQIVFTNPPNAGDRIIATFFAP